MIRDNLEEIRKNIAEACGRVGRNPVEVVLLAVSKTKPLDMIKEAVDAGQRSFGENYVQEIVEKYEVLGDSVDWHMIGHLQRNKVKYIIDKVSLIHSVDSLRLAEQIEKEAEKKGITARILLEVNVADEESKWGFAIGETIEVVRTISKFPHVHICGLMTSAPITDDSESNREYFRALRGLFDEIAALSIPGVEMSVLSMGMTGDYVVAVEEGSTMVRVGTAVFGARDYSA
ncbi:MAG: YggS family pyridoxal phosphate-dependent enzyme [Eubacteriales bacterium]|nr:YggS family pyridoxal phosphate-dependent enzyme [Eubacteriales bacterium]